MLDKIAHALKNRLFSLSKWINGIGAIALFIMVVITVSDVFMRFVFNKPFSGSYEITTFLMVIASFLGFAYVEATDSQISVDLVFRKIPQKIKPAVSCFVYLLSFGLFVLLSRQTFIQALQVKATGESGAMTGFPVYTLWFVAFGGIVMLSLLLFVKLVFAIRELINK